MSASRANTEIAVHPDTGEVLEQLDQQSPEVLAEWLDAIRTRQAQLKDWSDALEAELRARLKTHGRKIVVFGDWEVQNKTTRESEWDPDELERAMQQLVDQGVVQATELVGIINRDPVVVRSKANQLRDRLQGEPRTLIEACCTWREKRRGQLIVARSVHLLPDSAVQEISPEDGNADRDGSVSAAAPAPVGSSEPPEAGQAPSPGGATHSAAGPVQSSSPNLDLEELFA